MGRGRKNNDTYGSIEHTFGAFLIRVPGFATIESVGDYITHITVAQTILFSRRKHIRDSRN